MDSVWAWGNIPLHARDSKFQNICFVGNEKCLPPKLKSPAWIAEPSGLRRNGKLQEFRSASPSPVRTNH